MVQGSSLHGLRSLVPPIAIETIMPHQIWFIQQWQLFIFYIHRHKKSII